MRTLYVSKDSYVGSCPAPRTRLYTRPVATNVGNYVLKTKHTRAPSPEYHAIVRVDILANSLHCQLFHRSSGVPIGRMQ